MNILVIGHLCLDIIHPFEGEETRSYGGIYYSVITLARLLEKGDSVIPVFGVNKTDYQPLVDHLSRFPTIDCSGIFKFDEPTNTVRLDYGKTNETRYESSANIAKPIPYQSIRRHLSVDGILINMISGFDLELETLDHIRMAVRPRAIPLHFDFHSLTLGVIKGDQRIRRPVEQWRRWAFMVDTVQLNEEEILGLAAEPLTEEQTAGHLLTLGTKGVIVTRGSRGATVYQTEKKHVVRTDVEGIPVGTAPDTTGCGDVFGASFFLNYLKTHDIIASTKVANATAASRIGTAGAERFWEQIREPATVAEGNERSEPAP